VQISKSELDLISQKFIFNGYICANLLIKLGNLIMIYLNVNESRGTKGGDLFIQLKYFVKLKRSFVLLKLNLCRTPTLNP
jgi:hypothetical protein